MLHQEKLKIRGIEYIVREMSFEDFESFEAFKKQKRIKDGTTLSFVMSSYCVFNKDGSPVFQRAKYKNCKKEFSISFLGQLIKKVSELNDFSQLEGVTKN